MKATISWCEQACFLGMTGSGHKVLMDGPPEGGGKNQGPRPMEMLLLGLGACGSYDVISILHKGRQKIATCEVQITATRREEDPKTFTEIHLHYIIAGDSLSLDKVERAIQLSVEKYCSASIMLGATAEIRWTVEIQESTAN